MAANRPVTGDEVETMAAISPLGTRVVGDIIVFCVCVETVTARETYQTVEDLESEEWRVI